MAASLADGLGSIAVDRRFDRRPAPWQDGRVRRFVLASLAGIALLLAGSLAFIEWMTPDGPGDVAPSPSPAAQPPSAPSGPRPQVVAPPPPSAPAPALDAFLNPPPKAVPEPPTPPPPVDLARDEALFQSIVSRRCGSLQVRLGDEMRKKGDEMTGQAILLVDVQPLDGKVKLGQSRQQSPGNVRPGLVACAQMALKEQVVSAPGVRPGERFTVQLLVGMRGE